MIFILLPAILKDRRGHNSEDYIMRIAIVDDDIFFTEKVERTLKTYFEEKRDPVKIQCCDAEALLKELEVQNGYDIYFVDVEMLGMDGLELAEKIHEIDARARVVFLTSFEKYAYQGYRVKAYYYMMKDAYQEELPQVLERVQKEEESEKDYYRILTETRYCKFKMSDILYLTKEKKYAMFHCVDGSEYRERKSVENVYHSLPQERFVVVNRGIVVNMKYVMKYGKMELTMQDGKVFLVSRRENVIVKRKLADYFGTLL